jgi:hypothetical protein
VCFLEKNYLILNTKNIVNHNHHTEHTNALCAKLQSLLILRQTKFKFKWSNAYALSNKRHFASIVCLSNLKIMTVF